jgi:hypothetical protein
LVYTSIARGYWDNVVCPLERYKITSKERLELVCFYESKLGKNVYSQRRISIEPLIEYIKSVFRIDPLSVHGFHDVYGLCSVKEIL